MKPRVGLVLGDGGGIGAELAAKLLALPETAGAADITVIGDRRLLARGAKEAELPVASYPNVQKWSALILAMPAWRDSAPRQAAAAA